MNGGFGLTVKPNPAQEGGSVTIRGEPDAVVYVSVGPGKSFEKKLDGNGKVTIKVPVKGGEEFTVGDGAYPKANEVVVTVVSNGK